MTNGLLGKKLGMTQMLDETRLTPVTVIEAGPCRVVMVKTKERDGYEAVQLAFGQVKDRKLSKAQLGHLKKHEAPASRVLREFKKDGDVAVGQTVKADIFKKGDWVDVIGVSKGKGFQGVVRRHHYAGGPESHGSMFHRAPGSIGASSFPSRVWKGKTLPGHMGAERVTTQRLKVIESRPDENLLVRAWSGSRRSEWTAHRQKVEEGVGMPTVDVVDLNRRKVGSVELPAEVFGCKPHATLVHEAVVMQQACERQGTASTLRRGEVRGSGKKPWKQKHTGRARAGSVRSPVWRHGGSVFGPKPRSYAFSMPKKKYRAALQSALSAKVTDGQLFVVSTLSLEQPKTKVLPRP